MTSSSFDLVRTKTMKISKPTLVAPDLADKNGASNKQLSVHNELVSSAFTSLQSFLIHENKLILPKTLKISPKLPGSSAQLHKKSQFLSLALHCTQQIEQTRAAGYDYEREQRNFDERYDTKSKKVGEWDYYVKSEARSTKLFYHFINAFRLNPETGSVQIEAIEYDAARDSNIELNLTHPTRWADGAVHQFFALTQQRDLPDLPWKMRSIRAEKVPASGVTLPPLPSGKKSIVKPGEPAFYAFLAGQPGALRMFALHTPGQKLGEVHITKGQHEGFYEEIVIHFVPDDSQ